MKTLNFYRQEDPYGYFSNFWPAPIVLEGQTWPTTEHYFQAQKYLESELQEYIRASSTPGESAKKGRDRAFPLRSDWESVKDEVMYQALEAKFTEHEDLKIELLETGDARLVEHTRFDAYWGDGGDGSGRNMLGRLLMRLRQQLENVKS